MQGAKIMAIITTVVTALFALPLLIGLLSFVWLNHQLFTAEQLLIAFLVCMVGGFISAFLWIEEVF